MKEYIERASVHDLVKSLPRYQMFNYDRTKSLIGINPDDVDFGVDEIPAADVVEVVRCRDCKWFNHYTMECESDDVATDHEGGASFSINFGPDDFCSYGQRKIETVLPKSDAKDESLEDDERGEKD